MILGVLMKTTLVFSQGSGNVQEIVAINISVYLIKILRSFLLLYLRLHLFESSSSFRNNEA